MNWKKLEKESLIVFIIAIILFFLMVTSFVIGRQVANSQIIIKPKEPTENLALSKEMGIGLPVILKIPKISVDSNIEYVGVTSDGAMGVPSGPDDTAWYDLGPRPGQEGSSVIAGHSGWKDGIPAAFDNLYKLDIGDKIYVEDEFGSTTIFIVRKVRTYAKDKNDQDVFSSIDEGSHLNLITCTGLWDKINKVSSDRLIVFTDKVTE